MCFSVGSLFFPPVFSPSAKWRRGVRKNKDMQKQFQILKVFKYIKYFKEN